MGTGILVCGLNGAGKSTLGKALAEKLHFYFIDDEELYFPQTASDVIYASSRTREEAVELLFRKIRQHKNFVIASVKGNYGASFYPFIQCIIARRSKRYSAAASQKPFFSKIWQQNAARRRSV